MTYNGREKIALFRFGIISLILNGQVTNQKEYLAEVSAKVHNVPYYDPKEYELAGTNHPIFTPQAIEAIALRSRELPRLINNLATNSLLKGFQMKAKNINEEIVFKACEESGL